MKHKALYLLTFSAVLGIVPPVDGQLPQADNRYRTERPANPFRATEAPPIGLQNSSRIDSLMRAGQLYLSLQDAIALALENNLDIELQRYGPGIASSEVLRTAAGGLTRGVSSLSAAETPAGLGGPASPLLAAAATTGVLFSSSVQANISDLAALSPSSVNLSIANGSFFSSGTAIPGFDPLAVVQLNAQHQTVMDASPLSTGSNALGGSLVQQNYGYLQGFSPGTAVNVNFAVNSQNFNAITDNLNPYTGSSLGFTVTQPLLRGFGMALNRRYIRIARNERKITDEVFRQQLISTVSGTMRLYYDLVALNEDVGVKQQTLEQAEKLLSNNEKQVQAGTMAPLEVVRAQAQVAAAREDLINSQAFAREQELILKNVITKRGTADPPIRTAHIVATTPIPEPDSQQTPVTEELIQQAFQNRPDLAAAGLQVANSQITLEGSRNAVRPELDLIGLAQNNGLAGQANPVTSAGAPPQPFIGGFGTTLEQILRRNYPTYEVGIQLSLPVRNRLAQADLARDELQARQLEITRQQVENQVRLQVEDAVIALERSRASYEAAVQTRVLQERALADEQKRFAVGLSTTYLVIQYQSYLAQARSTEVASKDARAKAVVALERALGLTLVKNGITLAEAYEGKMSRPPSALPK
jgi:outer membrane protein TolC